MIAGLRMPRSAGWKSAALLAVLSAGLLSGCATPPDDPQGKADFEAVNDPLEPVNRALFELNRVIDNLLLKPVAFAYSIFVPVPLQTGVHNALVNLKSPIILANDLLQGETDRAGQTVERFAINSTVGLLGTYDAADKWFGVAPHTEDFGQTLATWGAGEGPYLFIPIIGPSNPRDLAGLAVDTVADPLNWYLHNTHQDDWIWARTIATGVDSRAALLDTLDNLEKTSLDYYVTLRSVYRQRRADEINNRRPRSQPVAPSLSMSMAGGAASDIETAPAK